MSPARAISNTDDLIDSRDVIARIAELESDRDDAEDTAHGSHASDCASRHAAGECTCEVADAAAWLDSDDAAELAALLALQSEAEGYSSDWRYGATLIADSYFEDYAKELAEDIGAIGRDAPWPACHIDWEATADALKMDYTSVDFDGETYWVR